MNHLMLLFYLLCALSGVVSIALACLIYLIRRRREILLFTGFIFSLMIMIVPSIALYYLQLASVETGAFFRIISHAMNIAGLLFFFIIAPVFFHQLTGRVLGWIEKIIWILLDLVLLSLISVSLLIRLTVLTAAIQILFLSGMILYLIILASIRLKKIPNPKVRQSMMILSVTSAVFLPVFIVDILLRDHFFALPLFYLFLNLLSVVLTFSYFNQKPEDPAVEIRDSFIAAFHITVREKEVIELFVKGGTYQEIADRLFISYKTVDNHVRNIYQKTGVRNRLRLLQLIMESR